MSMMDRIYAHLLNEMRDLEDFVAGPQTSTEQTKLITQDVTIKYTLNGEDKYLDLDERQIRQLIEQRAVSLRRELATAGRCDPVKED